MANKICIHCKDTHIYLDKDIEEERLKRRVLKNIKMLGIDDLKSEEAKFIVCPQLMNVSADADMVK